MNFPRNLRNLRHDRGLTQQQLATRSKIAASQIGNFECGVRLPNIANLIKLKRALECTYDELLK